MPQSDRSINAPATAEAIRNEIRWLRDEALPLSESQCQTAATEAAYIPVYNRQIMYANRLFKALRILEGLSGQAFQLEELASDAPRVRVNLTRGILRGGR